jgi:uncharacterized protein
LLTIEKARTWYPGSDPVHGFEHVLRVYRMAERLAEAEGADWEIIRAAVLLHDAEGASQNQSNKNEITDLFDQKDARNEHHQASAEFAGQVLAQDGWPDERIQAVKHAIRAHRFRDDRDQPQTLEAKILFDADKLDAIGAIGVARAIAYAARAGQPVYANASQRFIEMGEREPGEPHSAYHEYLFKLRHLQERLHTPSARKIAEERHRYMTDFFSRLGLEIDGKL